MLVLYFKLDWKDHLHPFGAFFSLLLLSTVAFSLSNVTQRNAQTFPAVTRHMCTFFLLRELCSVKIV